MRAEGMTLDYAPDDDYLAITFGQPSESVSLPSDAGVYLLLDPDSGELNALEVPFFRETLERGKLKDEFWQVAAKWINAGHTSVHIPPHLEDRAEEAFRQLIPA